MGLYKKVLTATAGVAMIAAVAVAGSGVAAAAPLAGAHNAGTALVAHPNICMHACP
jgi:hypothetical protein